LSLTTKSPKALEVDKGERLVGHEAAHPQDPDLEQLQAAITKDLKLLVHPGLDHGLTQMGTLAELPVTKSRLPSLLPVAVRESVRKLVLEAIERVRAENEPYGDAAEALLLLRARTRRAEDTATFRRDKAGEHIGASGGTFRRHHEYRVLTTLAEQIVAMVAELGEEPSLRPADTIAIGWDVITPKLREMHRRIEQHFLPEVVVTMSGPGSFAAWYCMSFDGRDVPVVVCNTFPQGRAPGPMLKLFAQAAEASTLSTFDSTKWKVFVPAVLAKYPKGSRVLMFDDRVMSGDTQRQLRALLEGIGMQVQSAAMIVDAGSEDLVDFFGLTVDSDYVMPWGSRRGRD